MNHILFTYTQQGSGGLRYCYPLKKGHKNLNKDIKSVSFTVEVDL